MDANRGHDTAGSETKDILLLRATAVDRISAILLQSVLQAPIPTVKGARRCLSRQ